MRASVHRDESELDLPDSQPFGEPRSKPRLTAFTGCLAAIAFFVGCFLFSLAVSTTGNGGARPRTTRDQPRNQPRMAFAMAKEFVVDRLKAPSTAEFARFAPASVTQQDGTERFTVVSYVDSQNSFGATVRTHFVAVVEHRGNDRWVMTDFTTSDGL